VEFNFEQDTNAQNVRSATPFVFKTPIGGISAIGTAQANTYYLPLIQTHLDLPPGSGLTSDYCFTANTCTDSETKFDDGTYFYKNFKYPTTTVDLQMDGATIDLDRFVTYDGFQIGASSTKAVTLSGKIDSHVYFFHISTATVTFDSSLELKPKVIFLQEATLTTTDAVSGFQPNTVFVKLADYYASREQLKNLEKVYVLLGTTVPDEIT
jgi:hypothetical protein